MKTYFSDREFGQPARVEQEISPVVWAGIVAVVESLIQSGAFGMRFPLSCQDGQAVCGHDANSLGSAVAAHMPGLQWPLLTHARDDVSFSRVPFSPPTPLVLDLVEFVYESIGQPIQGWHHDYARHHHLTFDQVAGQAVYRGEINTIFARNGIAYELNDVGQVRRVLPPVIGEDLKRTYFKTGDRTLDVFLDECRTKFSDRNPLVRREALERLCDAWERLKTLRDPSSKPKSIKASLDSVTTEPVMRGRLEQEAKELTDIANAHLLRHSEVKQVPVIDVDQVDYLFHRLFALIHLLLKKGP